MEPTLALTQALIRRPSVTPEDAGCLTLIAERLEALGFHCERMDEGGVSNLWAVWGTEGPTLAFAGHTDVVPPGPEDAWTHPPFEGHFDGEWLWGRGAADMKGSLAAMVCAAERLCQHPRAGRLAFLLTSDEEGPAQFGTRYVADVLEARGELPQWVVVGEPSSAEKLGDVIRVGRRGSLGGHLEVRGVQGHVAYPEKARNPIHEALAPLAAVVAQRWDDGYGPFPPTTFQISNVNAGTGATNVIPGTLTAEVNFRFNPGQTPEGLQARVEACLEEANCDYTLSWTLSGPPFFTDGGPLIEATEQALGQVVGYQPERSTGGGTSDGRFLAPRGMEVVELGPMNATIHKIDERVLAADLPRLRDVYEALGERLLPRLSS